MSKSKLYKVLEHFNKVEINRLKKYVASPYFNSNPLLGTILELVTESIDKEEIITDEELMEKADPEETDILRFRKKMSLVINLVQDFMAQEKFEEYPMHKVNYLLEAHKERKIPILEASSLRKSDRLVKRQFFFNADYHLQTFKHLKNKYELSELELTRDKKGVLENFNPHEIDDQLDEFYFVEKLRLMISLLYWSNVYEHDYQITFFQEIIAHIESKPIDSIAVNIYYQVYKTYDEPDVDIHYKRLFSLIQEHIEKFPHREANDILESAINYCLRKSNKGDRIYLEELLKLYKEGIRTGILFVNEVISPVTFRNICTAAMRLSEYQWVSHFIEHHQNRLPVKSRSSLVHLTKAQLLFYQKRFKETLPLLQNYESLDPNLNLGARLLHCAALYELDLYSVLDFQLESFKVLLYRGKTIPDKLKKPNILFVKYLRRILSYSSDKRKLVDLYKLIHKKKDAYNTSWLLEKIEELTGPIEEEEE